jgi:hypothetical protein
MEDVPLPLGYRTIPVPQLAASNSNSSQRPNCSSLLIDHQTLHSTYSTELNCTQRQSLSYVTTHCQSASLCWFQAPIWGIRPDFYYCLTVVGLLMWDTLSDERTGLPFTIAADPRQRSHSWVRVPRDS